MNFRWILGLFLVTLTAGCSSDEDPVVCDNLPGAYQNGLFILNQGNFQFGNATLSHYDIEGETTTNDLFVTATGNQLGDVAQSMAIANDIGYIVVNNSQKVEMVNLNDMLLISTITGFNSPRYMEVVGPNKAYVTDLYADQIWIVDLQSPTISGSIPVSGWTENMILHDDKVWVCLKDDNRQVLIVDPQTDSVTDSIQLALDPNDIVKDGDGLLWVTATSNDPPDFTTRLYRIDPSSLQVVDSVEIDNIQPASWLAVSPDGQTLYVVADDVYSVPASGGVATSFVSRPFGAFFYSVGVDPQTGEIYVANAKDFVQQGVVSRYSPSGQWQSDIDVGVIPGGFTFYY